MSTWETRAAPLHRRDAAGIEVLRVVAVGLLVVVVAWAPYSILRSGPGPFLQPAAVREGALEATPATRAAGVVQTGRSARALLVAGGRIGSVVLGFGRFERRASAEARARLVRSKGYFARVVESKAAYFVLSRPYRTHADAQFWSRIFRNLGLYASTVTRLEASAPHAVEAAAVYWRRTDLLPPPP